MKKKFLFLFILITVMGFVGSTFAGAQPPAQKNNKLLELKTKLEALKQKRQQRIMPVTQPVPVNEGPVDLPISSRSFLIGTSGYAPMNAPHSSPTDWQDLFKKIPEYGELFGVHINWNNKPDAEGIPEQVTLAFNVTRGTTTQPYIGIGFEPDHLSKAEADSYVRVNGEAMKRCVVAIARKFHPAAMSLGVESNRYYEKSPSGFQDYVQWCKDAYQAIKAVSPQTRVMNNFLLDYMRGGGRLSGKTHAPHWQLIQQLNDAMDVVSFTSYPFFDYSTPNQIPNNYFSEIKNYTSKPIMITETAWPSTGRIVSGGSEQAQVEYLKVLLQRLSAMNVYALIWIFPHDPNTGIAGGFFDDNSLRKSDGSSKLAFTYWQKLKALPKR